MARRFAQHLRSIGAQLADGRIDHPQSQRLLSEVLRQHFACARISYWTLHGAVGERIARCVFSDGDGDAARHVGEIVTETECPGYFAALTERRVWACADTLAAEDFAAIRSRYLRPDAARSLLEAALSVNGKPFAILCCEHVGSPRLWGHAEVMTMMRCAAGMSLFIARYERDQRDQPAVELNVAAG